MQKFTLFILPLLILVLQVFLSLPDVSAKLGINKQSWQLGIGFALIFFFVINQVFSQLRPFRRFQRFEATKPAILDQHAEQLIEAYRESGVEIRANVMISSWMPCCLREPRKRNREKRKLSLLTKELAIVWVSPNMKHDEDRDVKMTVNQGVSGEAYRGKKPYGIDLTVENPEKFNLNAAQLNKTRELKFVFSYPIRNIDPNTLRTTAKVIGVVNLDSRTEGAQELVQNPVKLDHLAEKAQAFSELCSQLY